MSIDPHFQSTMYGWWFFMGAWVAALASWSLIVMAWRRHLARYDMIQDKHFHDLGKLCFAFTAFWGYITFGQYLVIWYGNMGEETHWMRLRLIEGWRIPTLLTVGLMFVFPFFGLLSRAAKVFLPTFVLFAGCTIVGLWMTRYLEVYPSIYGVLNNIPLGLWEIGIAAGMLGIWGFCYLSFMDAFPRVRVLLMTSPYRDEVQVPVDPRTMEPLPAHLSSGMPVSGCRSAVSRNYISDCGALAQLGERLVCNQEVAGSIPVRSTLEKKRRPVGAPCSFAAAMRSENRQVLEADDRIAVTLQRCVIKSAFGSMHQLGDIDL